VSERETERRSRRRWRDISNTSKETKKITLKEMQKLKCIHVIPNDGKKKKSTLAKNLFYINEVDIVQSHKEREREQKMGRRTSGMKREREIYRNGGKGGRQKE